jgi:hypothetical protein
LPKKANKTAKKAKETFPNQPQNLLQTKRRGKDTSDSGRKAQTGRKQRKTDMNMENEHQSATNQIVTQENSERIKSVFLSLERLSLLMDRLFANRKTALNGECYYTDEELAQKLKLSRRSLQDYRNEGRIPYIKLGGKILYRSSDIQKMLEDGYCKAFRQK